MGSLMKSNQRVNNNNKTYALVVSLAFGAAILGVMVLHKLKEKRIFTLLVKEKDHELLTLHLLFQREKEFNQEARKKIEEMKNRVYSLRTQKLELDRRLLEMQSTISALKDERKVIELTLEEKRNEIQMLASGVNSSIRYPPRLTALQSMTKAEDFEDLKFHFKQQGNLQSEQAKLETTSTSVGTTQEIKHEGDILHRSDSFSDSTKGKNKSQIDDNNQRVDEGITITQPEKLKNVKETPAHLNGGNVENEEREWTDFHGNQDDSVIEESSKTTTTRHDEEQHKLRMRRKHSKSKRRDTPQNKKLDDEEQKFEMRQDEKDNAENEKKLGRKDQLALFHEVNPRSESGDHNQAREEEAEKSWEEKERKPTKVKSNRTETERLTEHGSSENVTDGEHVNKDDVERNFRKQITDEINNHLKYQVTRNQEILHSREEKKHENTTDNEQGNTDEESEVEDSEDADIHEPEIDRDDITRISESDPDEEGDVTEF